MNWSLVSSLSLSVVLPFVFPIKPAVSQQATDKIPVIVDDDGSPDGMVALSYVLQNPQLQVEAITVVQGEATPDIFAQNTVQMLTRLGKTDIPVAAGRPTPLQGNNAFPDLWRADSDNFFGVSLPQAEASPLAIPAPELIIQTIKDSPQPITILATGPLTNIAEAFRQDPSIAKNIAAIHVMGGAVYVGGNLYESPTPIDNEVAEWNIWVDPLAAQEVFSKTLELGVPLYLSPLDATNQIPFTATDAAAWRTAGTPEGILAADLMEQFFFPVIGPQPSVWDLVAAINLSEPTFCDETPLAIDVVTEPGNTQGQTVPVVGDRATAEVCLDPSFAALPYDSTGLFRAAPETVPESNWVLGLLGVAAFGVSLGQRAKQ